MSKRYKINLIILPDLSFGETFNTLIHLCNKFPFRPPLPSLSWSTCRQNNNTLIIRQAKCRASNTTWLSSKQELSDDLARNPKRDLKVKHYNFVHLFFTRLVVVAVAAGDLLCVPGPTITEVKNSLKKSAIEIN